jgi:hypothetical protein
MEYVMKPQTLINILKKELVMNQQFIFQMVVKILAAIEITKNISAFLDRRQKPNVLATVSWNG